MRMLAFFIGCVFIQGALAQKAAPAIPHSHASHEGGHVFMSGDDHLEGKLDNKGNLLLFLSDKFRKPLAIGDFDFEIWTLNGEKREKLSFKSDKKKPFAIKVKLGAEFSHDQKIFVILKRKNPPKGHIVGTTPVSFTLMDLH